MAGRIWLDKDGKVLVNSAGRVFLSDTCCCGTVKGTCWQLYSATVITGQDSVLSWSEPVFVDYQCATTPILGRDTGWKWARDASVATAWYPHPGSCDVCSTPLGADYPNIQPGCSTNKIVFWPVVCGSGYFYRASVVTYSRLRDDQGNAVGWATLGTAVMPNWRLTDLTPDDVGDTVYSQILDSYPCPIFFPRRLATIADPNNTIPYSCWNSKYGGATQFSTITVYSSGAGSKDVTMLANGVGIVWNCNRLDYALEGQGLMQLSKIGSRYTAFPLPVLKMTSYYFEAGCPLDNIYFRPSEWGSLELEVGTTWSASYDMFPSLKWTADDWFSPYIGCTADRVALGGWANPSACSSLVRELPAAGISETMMPGWCEYIWVSCEVPMAELVDRYIDKAVAGTVLVPPTIVITHTKCVTNWYRIIGRSWEGCPKDEPGIFKNWTTMYEGTPGQIPTHMLLDTIMPFQDGVVPFGGLKTLLHEDDDAIAAGSTVWRPFSQALGDGHWYSFSLLNYNNYPSWRSEMCSTAFEPVSVEVPHIAWRASDMARLAYPGEANVASASLGWPLGSLYFVGTGGEGWTHSSMGYMRLYSRPFVFPEADVNPKIVTDYIVISEAPTTVILKDFNNNPITYNANTTGLLITGDLNDIARFPGSYLAGICLSYHSTYLTSFTITDGPWGNRVVHTVTELEYTTFRCSEFNTGDVILGSIADDGWVVDKWKACGGSGVSLWPFVRYSTVPDDLVICNVGDTYVYSRHTICSDGEHTAGTISFNGYPDWLYAPYACAYKVNPKLPLDFLQISENMFKPTGLYTCICDYNVTFEWSRHNFTSERCQSKEYQDIFYEDYFVTVFCIYSRYINNETVGKLYAALASCRSNGTCTCSVIVKGSYYNYYSSNGGYVEAKSERVGVYDYTAIGVDTFSVFIAPIANSLGYAPALYSALSYRLYSHTVVIPVSVHLSEYYATRDYLADPWTVKTDTVSEYLRNTTKFVVVNDYTLTQAMPLRYVYDAWAPVHRGSIIESVVTFGEANVSFVAYSGTLESYYYRVSRGTTSECTRADTAYGLNVKYALTAHIY